MRRAYSQIQSRVQASVKEFDPFSKLKVRHDTKYQQRFGFTPATQKQKEALKRAGIAEDLLTRMSKSEAGRFMHKLRQRRDGGLCTYKQLKALGKYGITDTAITFEAAHRALDYTRGRPSRQIDTGYLKSLLGGSNG